MARGWESKSIEAQQDERERGVSKAPALTPDERVVEAQRRTLSLARARVEADLAKATNPAHRKNLEAALKDLDGQLGKITGVNR
jgi:hypothetical protein